MTEHTPGPELDKLIAERVMGYRVEMKLFEHNPNCGNWHYIRSPDELATDLQSVYDWVHIAIAVAERREYIEERPAIFTHQWRELPRYSTDITAAWEVVKHLSRGAYSVTINSYGAHTGYVRIERAGKATGMATCRGIATPHAICLAALQAVDKEEGEG